MSSTKNVGPYTQYPSPSDDDPIMQTSQSTGFGTSQIQILCESAPSRVLQDSVKTTPKRTAQESVGRRMIFTKNDDED